jgi:hypothetical protein
VCIFDVKYVTLRSVDSPLRASVVSVVEVVAERVRPDYMDWHNDRHHVFGGALHATRHASVAHLLEFVHGLVRTFARACVRLLTAANSCARPTFDERGAEK